MARTTIYQKIKEYLLEIIEQNKNQPEFMLPSEQQLCIRFGCSRIPAKRALNELCTANLITRIPGRGSFINNSHQAFNSIFSTKTICFLLQNISSRFSRDILIAANSEAERQGVVLFSVLSNDSNISEQLLVDSALSKLFDGLIIFPAITDNTTQHFQKLISKKMPILFVARNNRAIGATSVLCPDSKLIEHAMNIIGNKADKIGFISVLSENTSGYVERTDTYKRCAKKIGSPELICLLDHDTFHNDPQKTAEQIDNFFAEHPEMNGLISQNFYSSLISQSKAFRKTAITSSTLLLIDQPEEDSVLPFPDIRFIDQQPEKMGELAVQQLLKEIINHEQPQNIFLPPKIKKLSVPSD